jgi:hypothetical protein
MKRADILRHFFEMESDKYFIFEDIFGVKGLN